MSDSRPIDHDPLEIKFYFNYLDSMLIFRVLYGICIEFIDYLTG